MKFVPIHEGRATAQVEEGREIEPGEVLRVALAPPEVHARIGRHRLPSEGPDEAQAERGVDQPLHPCGNRVRLTTTPTRKAAATTRPTLGCFRLSY